MSRGCWAIFAGLCCLSCCFSTTHGNSVVLQGLTLYTNYNWFFSPSVYFQCKNENVTDLPEVKSVMHWYNFTGTETWQPLTGLRPWECKQCGLYQHLWLADTPFAEYTLCSENFSTPDGSVVLETAGKVYVKLECLQCKRSRDEAAQAQVDEKLSQDDSSSSVLLLLLISFASLGITISCVSCVIYLTKNAQELVQVDGEREKFIEMEERSETFRGGGESNEEEKGSLTAETVAQSPQQGTPERPFVSNILKEDPERMV